jgi:hypothetical protein
VRETDADWVLAVDVRAPGRRTAAAGPDGVRVCDDPPNDSPAGRPPLAVVVVHPATWPPDRVDEALADVARTAPAPGWPAPVPLPTPEAAAWRALEFGLVPSRGRLVVLDPVAAEAAVVDRDGDSLEAIGTAVTLGDAAPVDAERLVALARRALDEAPAGPAFSGVLLAGSLPGGGDDAALPGLVARVTGRSPLVPGDADRVAVLGAAALAWAAASSTGELSAEPAASGSAPAGPRVVRRPAGELPGGPGRRRRRVGPRTLAAAVLALLVVVAIVGGLSWHRARTSPSPYTVTCPDGQVVAYRFECPTLAPSSSP